MKAFVSSDVYRVEEKKDVDLEGDKEEKHILNFDQKIVRKRLEFCQRLSEIIRIYLQRTNNRERRCIIMDMEKLTNQELSAIKGGKWVQLEDGTWIWLRV